MLQSKFTNKLIHETSPYLLQHAHNPVDWNAWSEEALQRAKAEDKPILVSIGYSACHWCHVMERESFEDEATATIMNKYFVNIKIDREERPDLDHIYMDAVQAITGGGGWPLNVFLTPDLKPFYGGTYFPPVRSHNLSSWKEILEAVNTAYKERKHEIVSQAEKLTNHINNSNLLKINPEDTSKIFSKESLQQIAENILQTADKECGGFGKAPKFPQTFIIQYLLRHYHFTKHEASLQQALLSLDKMIQGGIYDHLGGGFARYSTDTQWKAPHFEKMLYDNALLLSVLAEAYQLTKKELYAEVIRETIEFIQTELCSPENGFYSALDADSEGIEGKYYVWDKKEIDEILGNESELFCKVYNVTEHGNWEHTNILWLPKSLENIATELNLSLNELQNKLATSKKKLLQHRQKRIRPSLDDKILLSWNCLMIIALCKAYAALGDEKFLSAAEKNIHFLENNFKNSNSEWSHTWKDKVAKYPAFLDDYAALINAYIHLQEATGKQDYLIKASALTEKVILDFSDEELNLFYFTSYNQTDVVVRKKEIYDGAVSSGNAVMAYNLIYLSIIFDNKQWGSRGEAMLHLLGNLIIRYPTSFGFWSCVLQSVVEGIYEIAVIGNNYQNLLKEILSLFIPSKVIQSSIDSEPEFPLLQNKKSNSLKPLIYVCKNYSCYQPVEGVAAMKKILDTS